MYKISYFRSNGERYHIKIPSEKKLKENIRVDLREIEPYSYGLYIWKNDQLIKRPIFFLRYKDENVLRKFLDENLSNYFY